MCGSQEKLSGIQALLFNRLQQLSATDAKGLRDIRSRLQDLVRDKAGMAGAEGKNIMMCYLQSGYMTETSVCLVLRGFLLLINPRRYTGNKWLYLWTY